MVGAGVGELVGAGVGELVGVRAVKPVGAASRIYWRGPGHATTKCGPFWGHCACAVASVITCRVFSPLPVFVRGRCLHSLARPHRMYAPGNPEGPGKEVPTACVDCNSGRNGLDVRLPK